ncbi:MAG: hypothetical protein JW809_10150, partial [Pirellulales bacterium]|nr:hypothetical protein [Pirellulales bacterium]
PCHSWNPPSLRVILTRNNENSNSDWGRTGPSAPLQRIFSLARACGVSTVVIEALSAESADDLAHEQEDVEKRKGTPTEPKVYRLSFFDHAIIAERELSNLEGTSFLGYAIIKKDSVGGHAEQFRIFEAVMRMPERCDAFIRGAQEWRCRVGRELFPVRGFLYAQQNDYTNVCAHVACRTAAARFHRNGDMTYREMNDLLGIDHIQKFTGDGKGGLSTAQMSIILEAAGAHCEVGAYPPEDSTVVGPPFQRLIYGSIESGYPAIVCFATGHGSFHAVPVFGHTFSPDLWVHCAELAYRIGPKTSYVPSDLWLNTYISHDDNWGPNYCIPQHFLHTRRLCGEWSDGPRKCTSQEDCVAFVLATFPSETRVYSPAAEAMGMDFLSSMLPKLPERTESWKRRLVAYSQSNLLVLRPLLIRGDAYLGHLEKMIDWEQHSINKQSIIGLKAEPGFSDRLMWMVELSVPELFSTNRRKVGEILIRADQVPSGDRDPDSYVLARVPGYFAVYLGDSNFRFLTSGAQGHVPLFGCE